MTLTPESDATGKPTRSDEPVRALTATQLGLEVVAQESEQGALSAAIYDAQTGELTSKIEGNNELLLTVEALLRDGFAGVIFSGPPGTGKSYYAAQIAAHLAGYEPTRVRFIQFHPSYQYEDFVEGYIPTESGFELADKHLLQMCEVAEENVDGYSVIVIDELSRSDPGRVFGEALTYIEMTKRDKPFHLASGREVSIPRNLVFIATMNPFDKGVDEVDLAFERRFARVELEPSVIELDKILTDNGVDVELKGRIISFFTQLLRTPNPLSRIGHAYFVGVRDEASLLRLWEHQLRSRIRRAFPLDETEFRKIESMWRRVIPKPDASSSDQPSDVGTPTGTSDAA